MKKKKLPPDSGESIWEKIQQSDLGALMSLVTTAILAIIWLILLVLRFIY